ncbi:tetratricopeptide repeat protein [Anaerobacillus sp. CMMVII]|uniref:tetratricopeptide repeat protein n=1 Tax=Anaerobacillus sp. CMMVII TaxID=2755588 RepID=UPI0021B7E777|nr:tetratricopeptide repeat protein [Anaerobacillus sp. CMMVII]MCT8138905.1 tetratricopeptide repeat protein [Anaerobacillus sp. CMMVII]
MNIGLKKSLQFIEEGKMEEALALLQQVNATGDHETKYSVAEIYYELGLVDLAKAIIEELLLLYPDEGELYTFMAELLIDLDEEDEAIEILLEIKESDPVFVQGQLLLADLYQLQGLDEVAEQKLLSAEALVPDEPVVLFGLGEFYLFRGDYLKSIPYYKRVLPFQEELDGTNIALRLAEAYSASGAFEEALTFYEKGISDDSPIDAHFGYGYTAFQIGEYTTAIAHFEKVIDMDESYSSVYSYLGEAYEEEGKIYEALQIFKKGIEIDEFNEALYVQGARVSLNNGYIDEGESYLRKVLAINPSNFEGAKMLASLLKKEERFEDLQELINFLKEQGEEDPLFDWFLATAKRNLDDDPNVIENYEEIFEQLSYDSDFLEEFGQVLLENGFLKKAINIFEMALKLDPSKDELKQLLFELEND